MADLPELAATLGQRRAYYLTGGGRLALAPAASPPDEYRSDPAHPVPYTAAIEGERHDQHMIDDQRVAAQQPDVLSFQTEPLTHTLTVAGPLGVDLWVSTSGTDADFVVKLIDVLPDSAATPTPSQALVGGTQRLVRADVFRGRFRHSFEQPEAFRPGEPAQVKFSLNDILHTFRPGHRLLGQVQSSWFPLVDMNPPPGGAAVVSAIIRLYHEPGHESHLVLPVQ